MVVQGGIWKQKARIWDPLLQMNQGIDITNFMESKLCR